MASFSLNLCRAGFSAHSEPGKAAVSVVIFNIGAQELFHLFCRFGAHGDIFVYCRLGLRQKRCLRFNNIGYHGLSAVCNCTCKHQHVARICKRCVLTDACPAEVNFCRAGKVKIAFCGVCSADLYRGAEAELLCRLRHFFRSELHRKLSKNAVAGNVERALKAQLSVDAVADDVLIFSAFIFSRAVKGHFINVRQIFNGANGRYNLKG